MLDVAALRCDALPEGLDRASLTFPALCALDIDALHLLIEAACYGRVWRVVGTGTRTAYVRQDEEGCRVYGLDYELAHTERWKDTMALAYRYGIGQWRCEDLWEIAWKDASLTACTDAEIRLQIGRLAVWAALEPYRKAGSAHKDA